MNDVRAAIRAAMGEEKQISFARRLGVSQTELSRVLKGERPVGGKLARALTRECPELREVVVNALLAPVA